MIVLMHAANAKLDQSGDLQYWRSRDYSKKPSCMVTTSYDEKNQAFLTIDCDVLQSLFTSPHSLSANGRSGIALGEIIQNWHFVMWQKVANTQ